MNRLSAFLGFFFRHLYTTFAWSYDFVAWITSMGQWRAWVRTALEIPHGRRNLELGHGPGHLLHELALRGASFIGVDPSPQMAKIAARRLRRYQRPVNLIRARAQKLPLPNACISTVYATFPSEYILDPETHHEVWRILEPGGVFVLLPVVQISGKAVYDRLAAWLFRVTGQDGDFPPGWTRPLEEIGFETRLERVETPRAVVFRVVSRKAPR